MFYLNHPDFDPTVVSGLYDFNGNGITAQKTIEPTRSFQDDEEAEGFDNIGDVLVMSDFLLKMLIEASEETIEMATAAGAAAGDLQAVSCDIRERASVDGVEGWEACAPYVVDGAPFVQSEPQLVKIQSAG